MLSCDGRELACVNGTGRGVGVIRWVYDPRYGTGPRGATASGWAGEKRPGYALRRSEPFGGTT